MKRVLFVNPLGIGDVLFSTPLVNAVKQAYPDAVISYICNNRAHDILKDNPDIANVHIFERDEYRRLWNSSKRSCIMRLASFLLFLRRQRFDIVFDMTLGCHMNLIMALCVGVPVRAGFNYHRRGKFLTHRSDISGFNDKHVIEHYLDLGRLVGIEPVDRQMRLFVSGEDRRWVDTFLQSEGIDAGSRICVLMPGCGASWGVDACYRRWDPGRFATVADHVAWRYGYRVLLCGEEKEGEVCRQVASLMQSPSIQISGKTTLGQFAAILNSSDLVITNDGGPAHMAVALRKKVVAIFGPVDDRIYGPYPPDGKSITVKSSDRCRPCYRNFRYNKCGTVECLKNVTVEEVTGAVDALLAKGDSVL